MAEPKPLPFEKELDGISKKTLAIHHDKLYAGYVKKGDEISKKLKELNGKLKETGELEGNPTYSELRGLKEAESFARNGIYLHEWYFDVLGGAGNIEEAPELSKDIIAKWGSIEHFIKYFSACGMAARGWAILAWDLHDKRLRQYNADAHNQGGIWGCVPIIVLDVYEHAYFIDFGSDRKAYIEAFWKNFSWFKAEEIYKKVREFSL